MWWGWFGIVNVYIYYFMISSSSLYPLRQIGHGFSYSSSKHVVVWFLHFIIYCDFFFIPVPTQTDRSLVVVLVVEHCDFFFNLVSIQTDRSWVLLSFITRCVGGGLDFTFIIYFDVFFVLVVLVVLVVKHCDFFFINSDR